VPLGTSGSVGAYFVRQMHFYTVSQKMTLMLHIMTCIN